MREKEIPKFELLRFNPRRVARGAEGAELSVTWPNGDADVLWMSPKDILDNIVEHGISEGLMSAIDAYMENPGILSKNEKDAIKWLKSHTAEEVRAITG